MKTLLSFGLLVSGLASSMFVLGQTQPHRLDPTLHFSPPVLQSGQMLVLPGPKKQAFLITPFSGKQEVPPVAVELFSPDHIIALEPDHMPCVVSRLSMLEQMPTKKLNDVMMAPMPNFIRKDPAIKVIVGRQKPINR